jgi:hypothetical protein
MLYKTPPWTGEESSVVDDMLLEPRSGRTGYRGGRPSYGGDPVRTGVSRRPVGGRQPSSSRDAYGSPAMSVGPVSYQGGSWDTLGALALVLFTGYGLYRRG